MIKEEKICMKVNKKYAKTHTELSWGITIYSVQNNILHLFGISFNNSGEDVQSHYYMNHVKVTHYYMLSQFS